MENVSTALQLYDGVSAPVENAISALNRMCSVVQAVQNHIQISFAPVSIIHMQQEVKQATQQTAQLGNYIEENEQQQESFNQSVKKGGSFIENLQQKAISLFTLDNVQKVLELSDNFAQTTAGLNSVNQSFNKVNGTAKDTDDLLHLVYQSAQDARLPFDDMAAAVTGFGSRAANAFGSQEEMVSFANLVQKQMMADGVPQQAVPDTMQQLSQAMGLGSSEAVSSAVAQTPALIQIVADSLELPIGKMNEMAANGEITADMLKAAIFNSADEINAKFGEMPMTWEQVFTAMKNTALMEFQPVLNKINDLANNQQFQQFAANAVGALAMVANVVLTVFEVVGAVGGFIADNWSIIGPIFWGIVAAVAAYVAITNAANLASKAAEFATKAWSAAQAVLNTIMTMNPIGIIILAVIGLIAIVYAVVGAINHFAGTSISATGIIAAAFMVLYARVMNNFIIPLWNKIAIFVNFLGNVFHNPVAAIQIAFSDMTLNVIGYIKNLAAAIETLLNKIPGVTIDITSGLDGFYSNLERAQKIVKNESGWVEYAKTLDYMDYEEAANKGYNFGEKLSSKVSAFFGGGLNTSDVFSGAGYNGSYGDYETGQIPSNIASTAENTGKAADSLEITSEDLKYLRDIAETEVVNRFTTAEIRVEMNNNNTISSDMDLDGVVDYLAAGVNNAMAIAAEGVHL